MHGMFVNAQGAFIRHYTVLGIVPTLRVNILCAGGQHAWYEITKTCKTTASSVYMFDATGPFIGHRLCVYPI